MRHVARRPALLLAAIITTAWAPAALRAQDPPPPPPPPAPVCAPNATVQKVLLSFVSDDTTMTGQRVPVRVTYPVQVDLTAAPESSGPFWSLTLADPSPLDSLMEAIHPRVAGLRSTPLATLRGDLRGGECVARAAFRLAKVWRVEVTSKPESVKVEERAASDPPGHALPRLTSFSSREVAWNDRLSLRVYVKADESFSQDLAPTRFKNANQPVLLTRHDIADRMCEQHNRCPNMFTRLLHGSLLDQTKLEEVSIRLVLP
jgi:hypothetical protein